MLNKIQRIIFPAIISLLGNISAVAQTIPYQLDATKHQLGRIMDIPSFNGKNPKGISLSVNNRYFVKNGRPWYPLMGEFHYWRYPHDYWEEEIVKMKSSGLQIVATYIYWGAHENSQGNWNWEKRLNLRHFINLCAKHGMYVWLRPGPYINGDVRGRGFPDRIYEMPGKRSNNANYLKEVDRYFRQIGNQTKRLYWQDGGPVIGVQLENEYASGDSTHISELKKMAIKNGMKPVYWTVTANTVFKDHDFEVLPMQGAYCYRGWESGHPLTTDFLFAKDQWIMEKNLGQVYYNVDKYPRATCEQGAGMQETHGARISVDAHIIEAHAHNQIGRGVNFLGYFMFQGGTQYPGTEMKITDGPMMPSGLVSYDYQAPLDEFGKINESYKFLKLHHLFLNDFGDRLVEMETFRPTDLPSNPEDTEHLRYTGRFNKKGNGFIFICNTQNYVQMPQKTVQISLDLPQEKLIFPRKPVKLADKKVLTWPVNFHFNGLKIKYATAQVLCKISGRNDETLFMYSTEGIAPELCIERNSIKSLQSSECHITNYDDKIYVNAKELTASLNIISRNGKKIRIVILPRHLAENAWKTTVKGREFLMLTSATLLFNQKKIFCRQLDSPKINISTYPNIELNIPGSKSVKSGIFRNYSIILPKFSDNNILHTHSEKNAGINKDFNWPDHISDVYIKTTFTGNLAYAKSGDIVIADRLNYGKPWFIGLKRFRGKEYHVIDLQIQGDYEHSKPRIVEAKVIPEYQISLNR